MRPRSFLLAAVLPVLGGMFVLYMLLRPAAPRLAEHPPVLSAQEAAGAAATVSAGPTATASPASPAVPAPAATLPAADGPRPAETGDAGPAPAGPAASAAAAGSPAAGAPARQPASPVSQYRIDPSRSSATYLISQTVAGVPSTGVGTSTGITGDLYITDSGLHAGQQSRFRVDVRNMTSKDLLLGFAIQIDVLDTRAYPYVDFLVDSLNGLPTQRRDGEEFGMTVSGQLTLHGVTRPATLAAKARFSGDFLTAIADTSLRLSEYGITLPDFGIAKAQDTVRLQVTLVSLRVT